MKTRLGILVAAAAALLVGCGAEESVEPAEAAAPASSATKVDDPVAGMARAVTVGKPGAGVDLKYEILAKPAVGTPFDIEIAVVATAPAETMNVVIGGMAGITITNEAVPVATDVVSGQVIAHKFTVLADQTGIYYVSVTVTTTLAATTQARTFSIPVLLGEVQATRKVTVPPPKDATGQAIQSMPAQER